MILVAKTLALRRMEHRMVEILRIIMGVKFYADDVTAAKEWYTTLLGVAPSWEYPKGGPLKHIEFRLGDYPHILSIVDRKDAPSGAAAEPGGAIMYWYVGEFAATLQKLEAMGAKEYEPVLYHHAEYPSAAFVDPFGNILGIMHSYAFRKVLETSDDDDDRE